MIEAGEVAGADIASLAHAVVDGDRRSLGRAISLVEEGSTSGDAVVEAVFARTGLARVVGITGPPGVGKSTLVNCLLTIERAAGRRVAVLAIDPSSMGGGGALLGDRVRMTRHALDPGVFIRSMANRGRLGGLAEAALPAVRLLDAAGYDLVLIETVGVGQAEIEVAAAADCVVVILAPGAGDVLQAAKSGVLEIGDIYAVNRADDPAARGVRRDLESIFAIRGQHPVPPVLETSATTGVGVEALAVTVHAQVGAAERSGDLEVRRARQLRTEVLRTVSRRAGDDALRRLGHTLPTPLATELVARAVSPAAAAATVLAALDIPTVPLRHGGSHG